MKYYFLLAIFFSTNIFAQEKKPIYFKAQTGIITNPLKKSLGLNITLQQELTTKLLFDYTFYYLGESALFGKSTTAHDLGFAYQLGSIKLNKDINSVKELKFRVGFGYSIQKRLEYINIVTVKKENFDYYWYDESTTKTKGFYIKPQIQFRLGKRFEGNLFINSSFNTHKNNHTIGFATNIFQIKIKN